MPTSNRLTGCLRKLECKTPTEALRIVARLHRNLGHPSNRDLKRVLAQSGASRLVVDTAEEYQCPTCRKLAPPVQVPKTTLRTTYRFNERLLSDTIWLQVLDKTTPVLTMLDAATRYVAARVLRKETSAEFLLAVERGWIKVFGPPHTLFVDSHRAWGSNEIIELVVSPGEAHERLAQLERRHQVLRRAVEMYLEDHPPIGPESLVEALSFVVPQLNQTLSVGGFSPTQWVLGYQPNIPGSLLDTNVNYSHLDPSEAFQHKMECRFRAATAVVKADNDLRLRRALLRQHRGDPPRFLVGQKCFYWREAAGSGPRIRWKGPAIVVLTESDTLAADTPALHSLVRKVQNRGTTVYVDLFKTNRKRRREDIAHSDDEILDDDDDQQPPPDGPPGRPAPSTDTTLSSLHSSSILDSQGNAPGAPPPSSLLRGPPAPQPVNQPPRGHAGGPPATPTTDAATTPLPHEEGTDSENLDDDTSVDPEGDGAEDTTTVPSTAHQPGTASGAASTPPSVHPSFSPVEGETFEQKQARIDRTETISHAVPPAVHESFRTPSTPETFAQRRARIDRSETISYGPRPSTPTARPTPCGTTTEHGFLVDVLDEVVNDHEGEPQNHPSHGLPAGWEADENGYITLEPIHDSWELKGNSLVRHHHVARDSLFNPLETGDCPVPHHMIAKDRVTKRGRHLHQDRWRSMKPVQDTDGLWTGQTMFKILPRHRKDAQAAFYTTSSGATTYAGTQEKRQKDAKNLNERILNVSDRIAFTEAKRKELGSFFTNNIWEFSHENEATPGRVLKAHFILKWSKHPDGSPRAKARLITQGFRDPDALAGLVDSTRPTLTRLGRTTLMSLASTLTWDTFIADITTAFLQGKEHSAERTLWIRLPADARQLLGVTDSKVLMRTKKPVYGLCDAPRAWFVEATRRLTSLGFVQHPLDSCLFLLFGPRLQCAIGLHVDDLMGISDPAVRQKVKEDLQKLFSFRDFRENQENFDFLGIQVARTPDNGLSCSHDAYLNKIKSIPLEKGRSADPESPATEKERTQLRALIGALQWAATQTSPHLQVHTSMLAGEVTKATVSTIIAANKALRFAKANSDVQLLYPPLGDNLEDIVFVAYSDARLPLDLTFRIRADISSAYPTGLFWMGPPAITIFWTGGRSDSHGLPGLRFQQKAKPLPKPRTIYTS